MDILTFRDVIELWPSKEAMAADVGATLPAVLKWRQRNSIPADWWASVLGTERASAAGLNAAMLTTFAAREPAEARS